MNLFTLSLNFFQARRTPILLQLPLTNEIDESSTFSRNSNATLVDFEGLIKEAITGEPRFEGVRRVENLLNATEDFSDPYWIKNSAGTGVAPVVIPNTTLAPNGTMTADTIIMDRGIGDSSSDYSLIIGFEVSDITISDPYSGNVWVKGNAGEQIAFRHVKPAILTTFTFSGNWERIGTKDETTSANINFEIFNRGGFSNPNYITFSIWGAQLEGVYGQTNQNPGEYVPNNGGAIPVQYFDTENGNTVSGAGLIVEGIGPLIPDSTKRGILIEEQKTNLVTYSENITSWTALNATTTKEALISPIGSNIVDKLTDNATLTSHFTTRGFVCTENTKYTISVYAKKGTLNWFWISENANAWNRNTFDIENGVVGSSNSNCTAKIENSGNGWYRCSITFTTIVGQTTAYVAIYTTKGDNFSNYTGTNEYIYLWGAQAEKTDYPSSYIKTDSSTITRIADKLEHPKPTDFNDSKGSVSITVSSNRYNTSGVYWILDFGNETGAYQDTDNNVKITDGTNIINLGAVSDDKSFDVIEFSWQGLKLSGKLNGGTLIIGTFSGSMNSGTNFFIGRKNDNTQFWNGNIKSLTIGK